MVIIVNMKKILTTRKILGLSHNSALHTKSYSCVAGNSNFTTGLDPNWVTGLVEGEGSFLVFIKFNPEGSNNLVRQVQLSFELGVHIKDIDLLYKLKTFFGGSGNISIPSTRKEARLKITGINDIFNFVIPRACAFNNYPSFTRRALVIP